MVATHSSIPPFRPSQETYANWGEATRREFSNIQSEADLEIQARDYLAMLKGNSLRQDPGRNAVALFEYDQWLSALPEAEWKGPLQKEAKALGMAQSGALSFGQAAERALRNFSREAVDPKHLLPLWAGGLLSPLLKLGSLSLLRSFGCFSSPLALGLASSALGTVGEAGIFSLLSEGVSSSNLGKSFQANLLWLGAMKGVSGGMSKLHAPSGTLRHGSAFLGSALGFRLQEAAGLRPHEDGFRLTLSALESMLHFHLGTQLGRGFLGPKYASAIAQLELHSRPQVQPLLGLRPALASQAYRFSLEELRNPRYPEPQESLKVPVSSGEKDPFYQSLFPKTANPKYRDRVVLRALQTVEPTVGFQVKLLTAYGTAKNAGSAEQMITANAIRFLMSADALRTSTGSFQRSLLQLYLTEAAEIPDVAKRLRAFHSLFDLMEKGVTEADLLQKFSKQGLGKGYSLKDLPQVPAEYSEGLGQVWPDSMARLGPRERSDLTRWIHFFSEGDQNRSLSLLNIFAIGQSRYLPCTLDFLLERASTHPMGALMLNRALQIYVSGDVHAKFTEMILPWEGNTHGYVEALANMGWSQEKIAETINGTAHTAYLSDMRATRKIVSVSLDIAKQQADAEGRASRLGLVATEFLKFLPKAVQRTKEERRILQLEDIFQLLGKTPTPQVRLFLEMAKAGRFEIRILTPEDAQHLKAKWNFDFGKAVMKKGKHPGERDIIYIKDLSPVVSAAKEDAFPHWMEASETLQAVLHEWEHHLQSSPEAGMYRRASEPMSFLRMNRDDRLASEVMAGMEETRWRLRFMDDIDLSIAQRLGENPSQLFRSTNDKQYYHRKNTEALARFWESLNP